MTDRPRVALVTGASGGIGAAIATALADAGHTVALAHNQGGQAAQDLAAKLRADGSTALAVAMDVTDPTSVDAAVTTIEAELGPVEIVVNNAGTTADGLLVRMTDEQWHQPLTTTLDGTFHVTRRVVRQMTRARWGRIVNVSSVVALSGSGGQTNYAAAKAGLVGFSRSLARELAGRQITVNVIAPGPIDTAMLDATGSARRGELAAAVPLGRIGRPEDVAAAAVYLTSEAAGYVTGTILPVDGGLGMGH